VDYEKISSDRLGEASERVRTRVTGARSCQQERLKDSKLNVNAEMTPSEVRRFCQTDSAAQSVLRTAMKQFYLSARAYHRILKLARTIADLDKSDIIRAHHVAEAMQYRPKNLA
jgi:magnesium chelatase family protein